MGWSENARNNFAPLLYAVRVVQKLGMCKRNFLEKVAKLNKILKSI